MMTLAEFHNGLRLLRSIDSHELGDPDWYSDFARAPFYFFIACSEENAAVIWTAMVKRGAVKGKSEQSETAAAEKGDHVIPAFRLDQHVSSLALGARAALVDAAGDDDIRRLCAMAIFLHQLCARPRDPEKMAGILLAVADDLHPDRTKSGPVPASPGESEEIGGAA